MEFLITAYDGTDAQAPERRAAARAAHLEYGNQMISQGTLLYAAAILNDSDRMIGSSMIVCFPSRAECDEWLKVEPYVTGKVWETVEVRTCRSGPAFLKTQN